MVPEINSYPSIYNLGHKAIENIFSGPVMIQEKVDGSQFSFAKIDGELKCRSKGKQLILDAPEKMFEKAIEAVIRMQDQIVPNFVYRCEYLQKPKHNSLCYGRTPLNNLVLFDVQMGIGTEQYLHYSDLQSIAEALEIELVPVFIEEEIQKENLMGKIEEWLTRESFLGGCKIEGVVIKNYNIFTADKKVAMAKYVSEAFKETHSTEWKKKHLTNKDVVELLIETYRVEVRWQKAVQHLKEKGELLEDPKDIGNLLKEVNQDILKEEEDVIKNKLFKHFWPHISRGITRGLPEWYKKNLVEQMIGKE